MEAREGLNTQDKVESLTVATSHLFEGTMGTCHPPGIAGEVAGHSPTVVHDVRRRTPCRLPWQVIAQGWVSDGITTPSGPSDSSG